MGEGQTGTHSHRDHPHRCVRGSCVACDESCDVGWVAVHVVCHGLVMCRCVVSGCQGGRHIVLRVVLCVRRGPCTALCLLVCSWVTVSSGSMSLHVVLCVGVCNFVLCEWSGNRGTSCLSYHGTCEPGGVDVWVRRDSVVHTSVCGAVGGRVESCTRVGTVS